MISYSSMVQIWGKASFVKKKIQKLVWDETLTIIHAIFCWKEKRTELNMKPYVRSLGVCTYVFRMDLFICFHAAWFIFIHCFGHVIDVFRINDRAWIAFHGFPLGIKGLFVQSRGRGNSKPRFPLPWLCDSNEVRWENRVPSSDEIQRKVAENPGFSLLHQTRSRRCRKIRCLVSTPFPLKQRLHKQTLTVKSGYEGAIIPFIGFVFGVQGWVLDRNYMCKLI